mgnify:CR=1 FL=1
MTFRAAATGLLLGLLIAAGGYINDSILRLASVTSGQLMPVSVFGLLIPAMLVAAPFLRWIRRSLAPRPGETAVVVTLMLAGCGIPARGLMQTFIHTLALPAYWSRLRPGWQERELLSFAPSEALPAGGEYDPRVMEGLLRGRAEGGGPADWLGDVPWDAWAEPLSVWMPLVLLLGACSLCLALIVHRQWSRHERLRYPIATFATSLLDEPNDGVLAPIFRNRRFWIGLLPLLGVHMVNLVHAWHPDAIEIPLHIDMTAVAQKWPAIADVPWGTRLLRPDILPLVVAFGYFLASDISLSLGLSMYVLMPVMLVFLSHGVDVKTDYMRGGLTGWQRFGSYLAFAIIMLYTGRSYYWAVLKKALAGAPARTRAPGYAVWACRVLILCAAVAAGMIARLGLSWPLAALLVGLILVMFLGTARISAETGLFFIQPRWQPMGVMIALFGGYSLGPEGMVVIGLACAVLCYDPSQVLMPYATNGLKICEETGTRPAAPALGAGAVYGIGAVLAVVVALTAVYRVGLRRDSYSFRRLPTTTFEVAGDEIDDLRGVGQLSASRQLGPLERLTSLRPKPMFLYCAGAGVILVLVFSAFRLRWPFWPLHPVMFLVWDTWPMVKCGFSFLLGWALKKAVTQLAGHRAYRDLKPLMVGIVAADLLAGLVSMSVGAVYYAVTGVPAPVRFSVLPG